MLPSLSCLLAALAATSTIRTRPFYGRRALLLAPMVPLALAAGPAEAANPVKQGMAAFAEDRITDAIALYDSVIAENPAYKPYLWQRGLALYYADRFADGADQFATDVAVNPNDTEEQIWHLLCLAQIKEGGLAAARPFKLTVGIDRRPVMRAAQKLFLSGGVEDERALAALASDAASDPGARFYASLYLSLYHESNGEKPAAETRMREAVATAYAKGGGRSDPMVELAKVAMKRRGWEQGGEKMEL